MKVVKLSALRTRFIYFLLFLREWQAVRIKSIIKKKTPTTSLRIEPASFRLVAQCPVNDTARLTNKGQQGNFILHLYLLSFHFSSSLHSLNLPLAFQPSFLCLSHPSFLFLQSSLHCRCSSVSIVTRLRTGLSEVRIPAREINFTLLQKSRPNLRASQPHVNLLKPSGLFTCHKV